MDQNSDEPRFWTPLRRRVVLVGYVLVLVGATHWPSEMRGIHVNYFDKLVHFSAFSLLGWLTAWALELEKRGTYATAVVLLFAIALFAAVDELTQPYVGRQCDPLDWVADLTGALAGIVVFTAFARNRANR